MRELRIGDRVRTKRGDGFVAQLCFNTTAAYVMLANGDIWLSHNVEPLPADIPRERVEALHAAVTARLEQLDASRAATWYASEKDIYAACHSDLSTFAEALRLLLEVDP